MGANRGSARTLSKKTQYTLRALYALGRAYGERPIGIGELARQEGLPKRFLEQILLQLKAVDLVESRKGKGGGYVLVKPPGRVTLGSVIRLMEGPLGMLPCVSDGGKGRCEECVEPERCGTRLVMREVAEAMAGVLDRTTLADVCRREEEARERESGLAGWGFSI